MGVPPDGARARAAQRVPHNWRDDSWTRMNGDRRWYEKHDGCFVYQRYTYKGREWVMCTPDSLRYLCRVPAARNAATPPTQGWKVNHGQAPAPTLVVMD